MKLADLEVKHIRLRTYRLIPSHYPPIALFERVSTQAEFDILYAVESLTNERLRNEVGEIALVAPEDRLFGQGTSLIMSSFTHFKVDGQGGRFNDRFGVFYCAKEPNTAIAETQYHRAKFHLDRNSPPTKFDMRELITDLDGELYTIAGQQDALPEVYDLNDYRAGQALGQQLKHQQAWGLEYNSVRHDGMCYAIFRPPVLSNCRQARHLEYHFDGEKISHVFDKSEISI